MAGDPQIAPSALWHNIQQNWVLHEQMVPPDQAKGLGDRAAFCRVGLTIA